MYIPPPLNEARGGLCPPIPPLLAVISNILVCFMIQPPCPFCCSCPGFSRPFRPLYIAQFGRWGTPGATDASLADAPPLHEAPKHEEPPSTRILFSYVKQFAPSSVDITSTPLLNFIDRVATFKHSAFRGPLLQCCRLATCTCTPSRSFFPAAASPPTGATTSRA